MRHQSIKLWLWVPASLIDAIYFLLPLHIVIFTNTTTLGRRLTFGLAVIFAASSLIYYFNRPIESRPSNFANSYIGMPLFLAVTFGVCGYFAAAKVLPFGSAMIFGRYEAMIVTVATNVFGGSERGTRGCRFQLPLRESMGEWPWTPICFQSAEIKQLVRQSMPDAPVQLTGWGNSRAILYWSALPSKVVRQP